MTPESDPDLRPGFGTLAAALAVIGTLTGLSWVAVSHILTILSSH